MGMEDNRVLDLTHLSWTLSRNSSETTGSFLKSYEESEGMKYYYKMSNFDTIRGVYGHECINEIVAGNIADALNISHLHYDLLHANVRVNDKIYETWLTRSSDFKKRGEHKLTFETYYEVKRNSGEDVWSFIVRDGLQEYFYQIFLLDYLICNRDRHGANIEVLEKNGVYRLAPVFDNGLSLLFSCYDDGEAMEKFDFLKDGPVNNYVGSISLGENLRKIPKLIIEQIKTVTLDKKVLFKGMEQLRNSEEITAVPMQYWTCIRKMVEERWNNIEKIFD